jgi:predicted protein tyrosine phosphatase
MKKLLITPKLYALDLLQDKEYLKKHPISKVISFREPEPDHLDPLLDANLQHMDHLTLRFHDFTKRPCPEGYPGPDRESMERLADYIRGTSGEDSLLVHCHAGVSRSGATGVAVTCWHSEPEEYENEIEKLYGKFSIFPNKIMIEMLDKNLGMQGRMVEAVQNVNKKAKNKLKSKLFGFGHTLYMCLFF